MALASWERDVVWDPRGAIRLRCLVDLDAPCNLSCAQCPRRSRGNRLGDHEATELVRGLAEQVLAAEVSSAAVVFFGGEPLLDREQLLEQARVLMGLLGAAGVACELGLLTNGTRLDQTTASRLAQAGFTRVCVTLGGVRDRHEARRRYPKGGLTYRAILANLRASQPFLEVTVRYELREGMDLVRLPEFIADLEQLGMLSGPRAVRVLAQPARSYAAQARELFEPPLPPALFPSDVEGRGEGDPAS